MGPEVEYFPNVSAICGTLQLNAIISVPGSECQLTGRDRATNSRLTGGATAPSPLGNHSGWGGNWTVSGFSGRGPRASVGTHSGPVRGPMHFVCACTCIPAPMFLCLCTSSSSLCASVHMLRHSRRVFTEHRLRSVCGCVYVSFISMCHHRSVCSHTLVELLE